MNDTLASKLRAPGARAWALALSQSAAGAYLFTAGLIAVGHAIHAPGPLAGAGWLRAAVGALQLVGGVALVFERTARVAAAAMLALVAATTAVHVARIQLFPELLEPLLLTPVLLMAYHGHSAPAAAPTPAPRGRVAPHHGHTR